MIELLPVKVFQFLLKMLISPGINGEGHDYVKDL